MSLRALIRIERPGEVISPGSRFDPLTEDERVRLLGRGAAVQVRRPAEAPAEIPDPAGWPEELEPVRGILQEAGIHRWEDLREVPDLTALPGIGRARAAQILRVIGG